MQDEKLLRASTAALLNNTKYATRHLPRRMHSVALRISGDYFQYVGGDLCLLLNPCLLQNPRFNLDVPASQ